MKMAEARRWLALYFLLATAAAGAFLLLFGGSILLPLTPEDSSASFQIIIPVLVGQLTLIFQWIAVSNNAASENDINCPVPGWAIKLPPILALSIFILAVLTLVLSNRPDVNSSASPSTFKNALTFSITILNASTVFLVARLFPRQDDAVN